MRKSSAFLLTLLANICVAPGIAPADDEIIIEEGHRGIPVQNAILTRRYGAVETEDEVAGEEFETGVGATNTFKFVHWRRWYRPYGGWYGYYGPRYYAGFGPRYYGYYGGGPYWGGYGAPYVSYYAPSPMYYGGYGGFAGYGYGGGYYGGGYGGCYYW